MNQPGTSSRYHSTWGKLGLAANALACVLPIPIFGIKLAALPMLQQSVLTAIFVIALSIGSLVAARKPLIGMLILPPCFFGLMCMACWWAVNQ